MTDTTRRLANYVVDARPGDLPDAVRREAPRAFVNWLGCALGGSPDISVTTALAALKPLFGSPQATVIGRRMRLDMAHATFFNCLSSSSQAYDDTHLATIAHPTGVTAAGIFALAEGRGIRVSGADFLHALVLGIEVQCRMSRMLVEPPAKSAVGMFMTGFTGAMGTAAAVGKLMGLDEQHMMWALAIAATQGAGFRETHGSMSVGFVRAHASRCGLVAALLAEQGFTASDCSLEAPRGFAAYATNANLDIVTRGLGSHYETLGVAYKPYACAIVVHPAIDVAREFITAVAGRSEAVKSIELLVHPLAVELSGKTAPINANYARISASHWVAATVLKGTQSLRKLAGLDGSSDGYVDDAAVVALRGKVMLIGDASLGRDEARGTLTFIDGRVIEAHVKHCRGSLARPMTDEELSEKFMPQALMVLTPAAAQAALEQSWQMYEMPDVGEFAGRLLGG